jgi:hypothetical protein
MVRSSVGRPQAVWGFEFTAPSLALPGFHAIGVYSSILLFATVAHCFDTPRSQAEAVFASVSLPVFDAIQMRQGADEQRIAGHGGSRPASIIQDERGIP